MTEPIQVTNGKGGSIPLRRAFKPQEPVIGVQPWTPIIMVEDIAKGDPSAGLMSRYAKKTQTNNNWKSISEAPSGQQLVLFVPDLPFNERVRVEWYYARENDGGAFQPTHYMEYTQGMEYPIGVPTDD